MHSTHYFSKLELTAINVSFCLGFLLLHRLETGLSVLYEMTEIWPQVSVQLMTQYRKDEEVPEKQSPAFHTHNKKNGHTTLNLYLATGLYWAFSQVQELLPSSWSVTRENSMLLLKSQDTAVAPTLYQRGAQVWKPPLHYGVTKTDRERGGLW